MRSFVSLRKTAGMLGACAAWPALRTAPATSPQRSRIFESTSRQCEARSPQRVTMANWSRISSGDQHLALRAVAAPEAGAELVAQTHVAEVVELESIVRRGAVEGGGGLRLLDRRHPLFRRAARRDDDRNDLVDLRRITPGAGLSKGLA